MTEGNRGEDLTLEETILLEEYRYCAESYWRNEEQGEKRVAALIGLATVLGSVMVLSLDAEDLSLADPGVRVAIISSLVLLLLFGRVTFLRIVKRNIDSDKYKDGMAIVRRYFVGPNGRDDLERFLPFEPYKPQPRRMKRIRLGKGGWLETVAMTNAVILGALAASIAAFLATNPWWMGVGVPAAVIGWALQVLDANRRYKRQEARRQKRFQLACKSPRQE